MQAQHGENMKTHRPLKKWARRILVLCLAVLLLPYAYSRVVSPWSRVAIYSTAEGENRAAPATRSLRVASYNIAHGRGVAESNWDGGSAEERSRRLEQIAELLREIDADIVVLNEVDFDSSWSYSINQAETLAKLAGYPFRAEERNLDFRILGWTWRFGNAVLSKHPITDAEVVDLPAEYGWETILAGKKRGINCDISINRQQVRVIGAHLSHRLEAVRVNSAKMLLELAEDKTRPTIIAGDLNSSPSGFPESAKDANGDNAIETLDASRLFQRWPVLFPSDEHDCTFHSTDPTIVIDWILIPRDWSFSSYSVNPATLSDHRLIYADLMRRSDKARK